MTSIVVSGALANKPRNGGNAWSRLSWILGFQRLGFDVAFIEQISGSTCVNSHGTRAAFEESVNLAYFREVTQQCGLEGRAGLIYEGGAETYGLSYAQLRDLAASADLLFNMSGHLQVDALRRLTRSTIFFDDDPGYTQYWHAAGNRGARLEGHTFYFTIGENIGTPRCAIPTGDISWHKTRPPVTLADWPVKTGESDRFTTVASWRGPYGPIEYGGVTYGLKAHEFRKLVELPSRTSQSFEIALAIDPSEKRDLALLSRHGWRLVDPNQAASDPDAFRRYVQRSGAEFSVAQGVYVGTCSGWFSDRSVRYLASGKPVLVQDTGFSRNYPVGEGLLPFHGVDDAVAGAERIARDYEHHAQAARQLAETYFDSDRVVGRLVEEVGIAP